MNFSYRRAHRKLSIHRAPDVAITRDCSKSWDGQISLTETGKCNYNSKFKKLCGLCNLLLKRINFKKSNKPSVSSECFKLTFATRPWKQSRATSSAVTPFSAPIHVKHWGADLQLFLKNGALGTQRTARNRMSSDFGETMGQLQHRQQLCHEKRNQTAMLLN